MAKQGKRYAMPIASLTKRSSFQSISVLIHAMPTKWYAVCVTCQMARAALCVLPYLPKMQRLMRPRLRVLIIQAGVGKASFTESALAENVSAFLTAIQKARPSGAKGVFMKRITISSTMGPGVKVDTAEVNA